jgi:hypothetical protein
MTYSGVPIVILLFLLFIQLSDMSSDKTVDVVVMTYEQSELKLQAE